MEWNRNNDSGGKQQEQKHWSQVTHRYGMLQEPLYSLAATKHVTEHLQLPRAIFHLKRNMQNIRLDHRKARGWQQRAEVEALVLRHTWNYSSNRTLCDRSKYTHLYQARSRAIFRAEIKTRCWTPLALTWFQSRIVGNGHGRTGAIRNVVDRREELRPGVRSAPLHESSKWMKG